MPTRFIEMSPQEFARVMDGTDCVCGNLLVPCYTCGQPTCPDCEQHFKTDEAGQLFAICFVCAANKKKRRR